MHNTQTFFMISFYVIKIESSWGVFLIKNKDKNSSCGKILVSFYFDNALNLAQPLISELMPKLERYRIQLRILGLRNLKSNGVMPVKRPFIKFDINSLKSIGESGKITSKNLFTEPKGFGNNPTLSTVIKFDCLLPEDLNLIPSLSVNN